MNIIPSWLRRKAVDATKYLTSSITIMEGSGQLGSKARPFNVRASLDQFTSWMYVAAMLNAQAVASVPLRLYVRRRAGEKLFTTKAIPKRRMDYLTGQIDDRPSKSVIAKSAEFNDDFEEVTEPHPALELLTKVNPFSSGFDLTTLRMLYLQMAGNAYVHPVMSAELQRPKELWIMPAQWMRVILDPDREVFVNGYAYGKDEIVLREFDVTEVIHMKLPNLKDLHYGMGKAEAAWTAIGLHHAKRDTDTANFDNRARPDWLVIAKSGVTPDQLKKYEADLEAKLKGQKKSGKVHMMTGEVQVQQLNFPPDQIGDAERVIEEIAAIFGVPITKLLANDPNRANAETGDAGWMRDTVLPYCRMDEGALNDRYMPMFGIEEDAFFAYDNPVPKDKKFDLDRRTRYAAAGIMTFNETRAEEGLESYDPAIGDVPRINGQSIAKVDEQGPAGAAAGAMGGILAGLGGGFKLGPAPATAEAKPVQQEPGKEAPAGPVTVNLSQPAPTVNIDGAAILKAMKAAQREASASRFEQAEAARIKAMPSRYQSIDFTPPADVRNEARQGMAWRDQHGRGGSPVGLARAKRLAEGQPMSSNAVRRMVGYFNWHAKASTMEGWRAGDDGFPCAERIGWAMCGGDAGRKWAGEIMALMDAADRKCEAPVKKSVMAMITKGIGHKRSAVFVRLAQEVPGLSALMMGIDQDDLAENGMEFDQHVTVKYGLTATRIEDIAPAVRGTPPILATLGKLDLFSREDKDYDVLIIRVESDGLKALNAKLSELPNDDEHPAYEPHLTIAYLKRGTAEPYMAKPDQFVGVQLAFNAVTVSTSTGEEVTIRLTPATDPPAGDKAKAAGMNASNDSDGGALNHDSNRKDGGEPEANAKAVDQDGSAGKAHDHDHQCSEDRPGEVYGFMPINFGKSTRGAAIVKAAAARLTKAEGVGDADDTARKDEPEDPINALAAKLEKILEEARQELIGKIRSEKGPTPVPGKARPRFVKMTQKDIDRILAEMTDGLAKKIAGAVQDQITQIMGIGGDAALAGVNITDPFNVTNPRVAEFVNNYSIRLADSVSTSTIAALAPQLKDIAEQGLSTGDMVKLLEEDPSGLFDGARANTIARTESARAFVEGEKMAWQDSGVVKGMKWLLAPDACFVAESLVICIRDGVRQIIPIEQIIAGDSVISHTGQPRRVLGLKSKMYEGSLIVGNGFAATPDHEFLTDLGWRPIGDYASDAIVRRVFDFIIREAKNIPSALSEIARLPQILGANLRPVMPILAVAENNQTPRADHEINDPSAVHGNLFAKRNARGLHRVTNDSFKVGPSSCPPLKINDMAMLGTEVILQPNHRTDAAGVFHKVLAALATNARNLRFEVGVVLSTHNPIRRVFGGGTRRGATRLIDAAIVAKRSKENFPAPLARLAFSSRLAAISATDKTETRAAARPSSALQRARRNLESFAATFAGYFDWHGRSVTHLARTARWSGLVYDIEVEVDHSFTLANGLIAHNCEFCKAVAKQFEGKVVALDEPFLKKGTVLEGVDGGKMKLDYSDLTGPPTHPGCRCDVSPVL